MTKLTFEPGITCYKPLHFQLWCFLLGHMYAGVCACECVHTQICLNLYGKQKWQFPDLVTKEGTSDFSLCWLILACCFPLSQIEAMPVNAKGVWVRMWLGSGWEGLRTEAGLARGWASHLLISRFAPCSSLSHLSAACKLPGGWSLGSLITEPVVY